MRRRAHNSLSEELQGGRAVIVCLLVVQAFTDLALPHYVRYRR
ncbi:MAG: hypothetical protein ACLTMP_10720 [Eggerthella lenta]